MIKVDKAMATFRSHFPQLQGVMIMIMISSFEKHNDYIYNEAPCVLLCLVYGAGMIMLSYNSMYTYSLTNKCPPRVAMFGVQLGEGAAMLSYNSTYTRSITNSPWTPPAPRTLEFISHSGTSPMLCAYSFAPHYNINP